jgi:hypothetical protein
MSERHITYDPIYNTVDRDNFDSLIEVERYGDRTNAFDPIIAATVDHFWDPTDTRYVDFQSNPMNLDEELIMPRDFCIELKTGVADKLDPQQQIRLANQNTRFVLSSILHGEQGALSLSASLTQILRQWNMPRTRLARRLATSPAFPSTSGLVGAPLWLLGKPSRVS